jgi:catechol 2,3-dioxygenase-like lactoylglutathione lyase family enzyme
MTPQRVNLITLGVADLDRSKQFYAALGWTPLNELPEVVFYQLHDNALGLFGLDALAKEEPRV